MPALANDQIDSKNGIGNYSSLHRCRILKIISCRLSSSYSSDIKYSYVQLSRI